MAKLEAGKPRPENDNYRILVLIQRDDHLVTIKDSCEAVGQEVVSFSTLESALHFLETKDHVDVCIAEAFLENESSFDFLRRMRNIPHHSKVPVMLVAWNPGEVAKFCAESMASTSNIMGAYKFLIMPDLNVDQMMKEVQAVLPDRQPPKKVQDSQK
jgi:DNA-binding NtrC family response regulator